MRATAWITCIWPGLTRLWLRGHWSGLAAAVGFSLLLNGALAAQFVSTHLLPPTWLWVLWGGVLAAWCVGVWRSAKHLLQLARQQPAKAEEDLFLRAQDEYLRGHWFEAESSLERLLRRCPEDPDAHLMLAGLYRHTRRFAEAERQLKRMQQLDGAGKWQLEIVTELELIERQSRQASADATQADQSQQAEEARPQVEAA